MDQLLPLRNEAHAIMLYLVDQAKKQKEGFLKFESDVYMPLFIELSARSKLNNALMINQDEPKIWVIATYSVINGDICYDPMIEVVENEEKFYPMSFRNDISGYRYNAFELDENGEIQDVISSLQESAVIFLSSWLSNIQDQFMLRYNIQQGLDI